MQLQSLIRNAAMKYGPIFCIVPCQVGAPNSVDYTLEELCQHVVPQQMGRESSMTRVHCTTFTPLPPVSFNGVRVCSIVLLLRVRA